MSPSSWSLPAVPCLPYEFAGALACHEHLRPQHGHDADDEDDPGQPSCSMGHQDRSSMGHQDRSSMGDDDARHGCYSAASFEDDYDYEQELDRWLEADPLSGFPDFRTDFRTCPAAATALSQHSADARLISEALSEPCCELSALLPPPTPLLSDADEHDPDCAPPRPCPLASAASSPPGDGATAEDIARLLLCSAVDAPAPAPAAPAPGASFVPLTSVPVPPVVAAAAAGDSSSGRGGSTCESASTSPRCRQSAFSQASSKLVQQPASQPAAPAAACSHKSGGPCDHCGATESPQWRRGPPAKPMLCNACGTRYRRTHQLGSYTGRGGKGGSLPGRKRRGTARVECRLHKQPKTSSLVVCAA